MLDELITYFMLYVGCLDVLLDYCWEENGHGAECDVAAEEHELLID